MSRAELWSAKRKETYQIDVIQEPFLRGYLKIIDKEVEAIERRIVNHRTGIQRSIDKLIIEARKKRRRGLPFRDIFEGEPRFPTTQ